MFYKYEIRNNGFEDILYLYLTMAYEFSKELTLKSKDKDIARRTRNFIKNNNIKYNGSKVFLVIDDIVVKSLNISNLNDEVESLNDKLHYSNNHFFVTVRLDNNVLIEVSLKEYLLGILATLYTSELKLETIKALCVLYRSFAFKEMNEKKEIRAVNEFCIYRPISYYKLSWINNFEEVYKIILTAIEETDCLFTSFNKYYTLPFIHYSNDGKTISSDKYKYLTKVSSLWDLTAPSYINIKDYSYEELSKILNTTITNNSIFDVIEVDDNGYINKLQIDNSVFIVEDLVKLLNLKSLSINIILNNTSVKFISKGYGYFFGLSIFGANEIAKNGCDFIRIIKYYFPNITISKYIKELS